MTTTKRVIFLAISIIVFFILVPLFILGIQGYTYNFSTNKLIKTGILIAKSSPDKARIKIQSDKNILEKTTPATVRFLFPGDYEVTISKENYHEWKKHFTIRGGLVTYANGIDDKINLVPKNPILVSTSADYEFKEKEKTSPYEYYFESSEIPEKFDLVAYQSNKIGQKTVLAKNLSVDENAEIISTANGVIFTISKNVLYQISNSLEYIAEPVTFAIWNESLKKLVYSNLHELSLFSPNDIAANQRELLNRTSDSGKNFCVLDKFGYVLRQYNNSIRAIELDGRNLRNIYELFEINEDDKLIDCDSEGKNIVILKNGIFYTYSLVEQ